MWVLREHLLQRLISDQIFSGVQHVSGDVLDLRSQGCGKMWDLHNAPERVKGRKKAVSEKPKIVIASCLDRWEDKVLLNFFMKVYEIQLAQGRHFLHVHFEDASAWGSPRMRALREHPRCGVITGDRGAWGQEMRSSNTPTKYLSSAPELLSVLGSTVTPKSSSVSLLRETVRDIAAQRRREGLLVCQQLRRSLDSGCAVFALESSNTDVPPEIEGTGVRDEKENMAVCGARRCLDAITQEEFPAELTRAARQKELDFMQDWHVWDVVPVAESWSLTGKALFQSKWVDINKGDLEKPVVCSRYVAVFANTKSNDFFSPTTPLEALRLLLSHAASGSSSSFGGWKMLVVDARVCQVCVHD